VRLFPRRSIREAQEQLELARHRAERPKIQQQFADLKRGLSAVTDDEWENIPEVGNLTKKKRRRDERTYVVPDSVLVGDRSKNEYESSLDTRQQEVWRDSFLCASVVLILLSRMADLKHLQKQGH
jgi:pre-mRNA-processing factor 6